MPFCVFESEIKIRATILACGQGGIAVISLIASDSVPTNGLLCFIPRGGAAKRHKKGVLAQ